VSSADQLIACVDVDYRGQCAVAAGVWFRSWEAVGSECESAVSVSEVADYNAGAFYRRELPCVLAALAVGPCPDLVIVDGYVWLEDGRPGLGGHLHFAIGKIVVGVAKTRYAGATMAIPLCRGSSRSPLFITAAGISAEVAAAGVAAMHGPHRIPGMLRRVDALARRSFRSA
jgi:deoxyribonuclease V